MQIVKCGVALIIFIECVFNTCGTASLLKQVRGTVRTNRLLWIYIWKFQKVIQMVVDLI